MELLLKQHWKSHLLAILFLFIGTSIYFYTTIQGKVLDQHDVSSSKGWHAEIKEFQEKENRQIRWTNTMFSGMPTAQIQHRDKKDLPWKHNFSIGLTTFNSINDIRIASAAQSLYCHIERTIVTI